LLFWQQTEKERIHVEKQDGNATHKRSAMLISAGMTWQQRLLFVCGIAFGVVVEALPSLVDDLKERVAEWRRLRQFTERTKAA
jgi:hypothetical protein